jgi:hypothetical protein
MRIRADYPGANILVKELTPAGAILEQDIRDTSEWWFYWNFRVEGAQGQDLVLRFANGEVLGPWGPCVSRDGVRWDWAGSETLMDRTSFRYRFGPADRNVYFSLSMPYQRFDLDRFLAGRADDPRLRSAELAVTSKGRSAPLLSIGSARSGKHLIFACRHHACESPASYQLEGIMDYFLGAAARDFVDAYGILVVPFVDLDGVEDGDQGKSRAPHDHNRDYTDEPLYPTVRAIQRLGREKEIVGAFDCHAPWKWGGRNDYPFIVKAPSPMKERAEEVSAILKRIVDFSANPEDILYDPSQDIEPRTEWNTCTSPTFTKYHNDYGVRLGFGFEMPYFGIPGQAYTQDKLRKFGACYAQAIHTWFESAR